MADVFNAKILSSLTKVFSDSEPISDPVCNKFTTLKNETISFQVGITKTGMKSSYLKVKAESKIQDALRLRSVENVPCQYPAHGQADENYLRLTPGLYPDILREMRDDILIVSPNQWKSVWIDAEITKEISAGTYPVKISFFDPSNENELVFSAQTEITVYDAVLPEQTIIQTQWFHLDCLCEYYGVDIFTDRFWEIAENFLRTYVARGFNMILTPVFTPPLDTAVGGERMTVQLVDVKVENGVYSFDFSNLEKWVSLCLRVGIKYFEISHLFTQWGAKHAPKIMGSVNGEYKRIFGWETDAADAEYSTFLKAFLKELTDFLKAENIAENTYFHLSDEPALSMLSSYSKAKEIVKDLLKDFKIIDALSDYEFYQTGLVERAVCSNDRIHEFISRDVSNMWVYYCTSQWKDVSNRFISMPPARTRIYGIQLYKYDIEGTLHWGYNFYNSRHSLYPINPYQVTDAGGAYPSGDAFLVYPDADGKAEESLRIMYLYHAITDLRALKMLERLTSREHVTELIDGSLSEPLTFRRYPKSSSYLLSLRNRVNKEIADILKAQNS